MEQPRAEPSGHRDAVFGLARDRGRVLMVCNGRVRRGREHLWWDLPGGSLRPGEALPAALRREWQEETGLQASVGALRWVLDGLKRRPDGPALYTWRAFFFEVACAGEPVAGEGIARAAWVPEDEVENRLEAPYHTALRDWLRGEAACYRSVEWVEPEPEVPGVVLPARRLLVIAAAAAVGDRALLTREVEAARAEGEPAERIAETLLQIVPYAGYPRAITAFGAVGARLAGRAQIRAEAPDRAARGLEVFGAVYGERADEIRTALERLDPMLARWTLEHAYGRVLAREGVLSLAERELLAVSVLTALGGLEEPLLGHMRAALRVGASAAQVAAAVQVVPTSVGEARRDAARQLLARVVQPGTGS